MVFMSKVLFKQIGREWGNYKGGKLSGGENICPLMGNHSHRPAVYRFEHVLKTRADEL